MDPPTEYEERVQFTLRGAFVATAVVALAALGARWLMETPAARPYAVALVMGIVLEWLRRWAVDNAGLKPRGQAALLAFALLNGFWLAEAILAYLIGMLLSTLAWQRGARAISLMLAWCGFSTTVIAKPGDDRRDR